MPILRADTPEQVEWALMELSIEQRLCSYPNGGPNPAACITAPRRTGIIPLPFQYSALSSAALTLRYMALPAGQHLESAQDRADPSIWLIWLFPDDPNDPGYIPPDQRA